ncbi:MAG: Gfo/Idh/MocA family oxidoreductase [Pirellulales bacterium]
MTKLRVAVIGAGHLGRIHTRLLKTQSEVDLVAVADPSPSAQQQIIDEFEVNVVSDYRKLIDQIDAAVVATPTRMHFEIANELLKANIHTLIEKPLTDSVSDASQLAHAAEESGCVVQVGHVEQFNPAIQSALGLVGQPKFIQATRMSGYTFRSTDIGVVHDLMIHDIDLTNSMFEGELVETRATGVSMFGHNEDVAHARLQFSCGGVANLTASRCSFQAERTFQIFGTDGFANADLATNKVTFVKVPKWIQNKKYDLLDTTPEQQAFIRENLFSKILPKSEIEVPQTNAILAEQQDWLEAIRTSQTPRVSVQQGAKAVEIADSVINSINAHRWSEASSDQLSPEVMSVAPPTLLPFPLNVQDEQQRKVA